MIIPTLSRAHAGALSMDDAEGRLPTEGSHSQAHSPPCNRAWLLLVNSNVYTAKVTADDTNPFDPGLDSGNCGGPCFAWYNRFHTVVSLPERVAIPIQRYVRILATRM